MDYVFCSFVSLVQRNLGTKSVCNLVTKRSSGFGCTNLDHSRSRKIEKTRIKRIWSIFVQVFRSHKSRPNLVTKRSNGFGCTNLDHSRSRKIKKPRKKRIWSIFVPGISFRSHKSRPKSRISSFLRTGTAPKTCNSI